MEEIAEVSVLRRVLKAISEACFARVAWRQPGGGGNTRAYVDGGPAGLHTMQKSDINSGAHMEP